MNDPVLFDLGPLDCSCTNHVLEEMHKSLVDPPGSSKIWKPHHDLFVRDHIEQVTQRGQRILLDMQTDLLSIAEGVPVKNEVSLLGKALGWTRFTEKEFEVIQKLLEDKKPENYNIDDWMMVVDLIVHRYLPRDIIRSESEYIAMRSVMLGKIKAHADHKKLSDNETLSIVGALPESASDMAILSKFSMREQSVFDAAKARSALYITEVGENTRFRIKQIIINHQQKMFVSDPESSLWNLQSTMLDEFGILNRDWRRIAVTEVAENANQGLIASLEEGTVVRRVEAYAGACSFCRKINGTEYTVVDAARQDKNGETEVWIGKTNVDRSSSPQKRVGDELVDRSPSELWWPASGVQHPHCRGSWVVVTKPDSSIDPEFVKWIDKTLSNA